MDPLTRQSLFAGSSIRTKIFNTPGTYSWTAPAGVNRIISLIGRGGSGYITEFQGIGGSKVSEADFYLIDPFFINSDITGQSLVGSNITYEQMRDRITNILLPQWQSITTNSGGAFYTINLDYYNYFNSNWYERDPYYYSARVYRRVGTVSAIGLGSWYGVPDVLNGTGDIPRTGAGGTNISALGAYVSNIQVEVVYAYSDTNSTAFGYTFPGQQYVGAQQILTYTNIAVTPGNTYTIVVGQNYSGGYIGITSFVELRY